MGRPSPWCSVTTDKKGRAQPHRKTPPVRPIVHARGQEVTTRAALIGRQFYAGAATALLSPQQGSYFLPPHLTQTLQPHRGDTMYLYSSSWESRLTLPEGVR